MRVEDLILKLQTLPPEATVWVIEESGKSVATITQIELRTKEDMSGNSSFRTSDVYLRSII